MFKKFRLNKNIIWKTNLWSERENPLLVTKVIARSLLEVPCSPPKFRVKILSAYSPPKNSALCLDPLKKILCLSIRKKSTFKKISPCFLYGSPAPYGIFYFFFGDTFITLNEVPLSKHLMALFISIDLIK